MFGHLVTRHRRRLSLTQQELAEITGLSERSIRRLESGDVQAPRPASVRLLADAFELSGSDRDTFIGAAGALDQATDASTGLEPPPRAERTLPADVAGFVGRHRELRDLLDAVRAPSAQALPTSPIYAIDGMAGVGKTAFAVHLAHRLAGRFPDGQRFVELRAHAPGRPVVDPATALATLLQADGVAAAAIPTGLDALAGLWRERLAGRRMLLLLDDAADPDHVAPLLPGTPGCLVLITSRRRLVTLPGVALLSLDTLPPEDAARLFVHRAGRRAGGDPAAIARITELCSHLPLAIALTAARLHLHPAWSVTDLADDLSEARD
ncbi:helix-turn-helix domain-containing protein [Paractinoplanes maris]|uniref:helix-turn-helix domain-containing protein n=1 Tax=Paractinoplanes maris TaxID=1734446 RepID=UPI0020205DCD|nr:helix-turn-helix domain-containing protein [Actinoplanes maris]